MQDKHVEGDQRFLQRQRFPVFKSHPFFDRHTSVEASKHSITIESDSRSATDSLRFRLDQSIPPGQYILRIITYIQVAKQCILRIIAMSHNFLRLFNPARLTREYAVDITAY